MGRTTLNPNQINPEGMAPEETELLQPQLKAIDPFAEVQLFNDKGLVTPEGMNQLINAAEATTVAINTIHLELHKRELVDAIIQLKEQANRIEDPKAELTVVRFVEIVHAILHELDRSKK